MEELKNCPICGESDIEKEKGVTHFGERECAYSVRCKTCGLSHYDPSGGGSWNWNTRSIENVLEDRIKELEEALARIVNYCECSGNNAMGACGAGDCAVDIAEEALEKEGE